MFYETKIRGGKKLCVTSKQKIEYIKQAFAKTKLYLFEKTDENCIDSLIELFYMINHQIEIDDEKMVDDCYRYIQKKYHQSQAHTINV